MALSVKHVSVPEGFDFSIRFKLNEQDLLRIQKYYFPSHLNSHEDTLYASPHTGLYNWDGIECWVYNQEKHGYNTFYFKSRKDYDALDNEMKKKLKLITDGIKNKLYRYNEHRGWVLTETYSTFEDKYLIGYDNYFKSIETDINNHQKHSALLKSIGESKSLTYLLYGAPGTGKTTLIKSLSSKYNMDVYVINGINAKTSVLGDLLNPGKGKDKNVILLFEDFDRFISDEKNKALMGIILNALDGFDDTDNTSRFFTGNDCDVIFKEHALINRISGKFKFGYPDIEMFRDKLMKLISIRENNDIDKDKINQFLKLIHPRCGYQGKPLETLITLRPFTSYIIKYLFNETFYDDIIANYKDLM